ncbi:MAG: hypothetical protein C4340_01595, partial [Armatimonadota bacterium]
MKPRARRPKPNAKAAITPTSIQSEALERAMLHALAVYPLPNPPTVEWKGYPVTAGRVYPLENRICLSAPLLNTEQRVCETLLHEYAHLVVYHLFGTKAKPHGEEWRRVMKALGAPAERTHTYAPLPTP